MTKAIDLVPDIQKDPFAINRALEETPTALKPSLQTFKFKRERLAAQTIVGSGQVS